MALFLDAFTISPSRTGDAVVSRLTLTGWSDSLLLEQGRLYWGVTAANDLEFYSKETKVAADLVCSGTITAEDTVVLAEDNSSGISGEAQVVHTNTVVATGEAIITYAQEEDLIVWESHLTELLDGSNLFNGESRFELPLKRAKIIIDRMVSNKLESSFKRKSNFDIDLSSIAKPKELAEAHALYTMYLIYMGNNSGDSSYMDLGKEFKRESKDNLDLVKITLDYFNDDTVDARKSTSGGKLTR